MVNNALLDQSKIFQSVRRILKILISTCSPSRLDMIKQTFQKSINETTKKVDKRSNTKSIIKHISHRLTHLSLLYRFLLTK